MGLPWLTHKNSMRSNCTLINFHNQILLVPYLLGKHENMRWKQGGNTIKLLGVDVCPTRHAKWSHEHHWGCTVFAWSITSGIISHIMKALVPLPCLLFFHPAQTFCFQIINYLIPFSLHIYSNTELAWRLEKLCCYSKVTAAWTCQLS